MDYIYIYYIYRASSSRPRPGSRPRRRCPRPSRQQQQHTHARTKTKRTSDTLTLFLPTPSRCPRPSRQQTRARKHMQTHACARAYARDETAAGRLDAQHRRGGGPRAARQREGLGRDSERTGEAQVTRVCASVISESHFRVTEM